MLWFWYLKASGVAGWCAPCCSSLPRPCYAWLPAGKSELESKTWMSLEDLWIWKIRVSEIHYLRTVILSWCFMLNCPFLGGKIVFETSCHFLTEVWPYSQREWVSSSRPPNKPTPPSTSTPCPEISCGRTKQWCVFEEILDWLSVFKCEELLFQKRQRPFQYQENGLITVVMRKSGGGKQA